MLEVGATRKADSRWDDKTEIPLQPIARKLREGMGKGLPQARCWRGISLVSLPHPSENLPSESPCVSYSHTEKIFEDSFNVTLDRYEMQRLENTALAPAAKKNEDNQANPE
jgi:hypothetical protein